MIPFAVAVTVSAEALALALGHLETGLNYYRAGQQERAQREFTIVAQDYADSPAADDALYWSAKSFEATGQKAAATEKLQELATRFPNSEYNAASEAPAALKPVVATAPPPPKPAAPASTIVAVTVKTMDNITVVMMNNQSYKTAAEFETALAEAKKAQPNLSAVFRRDFDVDLQMVMDAVNVLDKLKVPYRLQ